MNAQPTLKSGAMGLSSLVVEAVRHIAPAIGLLLTIAVIVNLSGRRTNYRLCALEGKAVPTEMVFEGNPMRIRLRTPFRKVWRTVAEHGFGHHWMAGSGQLAAELEHFCRLTGVRGVFPDRGEGVS